LHHRGGLHLAFVRPGRQVAIERTVALVVVLEGLAVHTFQAVARVQVSWHADPAGAVIPDRTQIPVVACPLGRGVEARSAVRVTCILGARVAVVARFLRGPGAAGAAHAKVSECAQIAIVAGCADPCVNASCSRVAGVYGTRVSIIAKDRLADAHPFITQFGLGAQIPVIARPGNKLMQAQSVAWLAQVESARIVIRAVLWRARATLAVETEVPDGAGLQIVARHLIRCKDAPQLRQASIFGTQVLIVTYDRAPTTLPVSTNVLDGALVVIVACAVNSRLINAVPGCQGTLVVSAGVVVVANDHRPRMANGLAAQVIGCTRVPVVTRDSFHRCLDASDIGLAQRNRTGVAVVTINGQTGANAFGADIIKGAQIAIVASRR
jgi:hypothetical protein